MYAPSIPDQLWHDMVAMGATVNYGINGDGDKTCTARLGTLSFVVTLGRDMEVRNDLLMQQALAGLAIAALKQHAA